MRIRGLTPCDVELRDILATEIAYLVREFSHDIRVMQSEVSVQPEQRHGVAGDLLTGYLEKRIGENSGRQSLPEAWRWQKRYFVLTEPKGMLYYFKSADDPPNYKGLINMRECKVLLISNPHQSITLFCLDCLVECCVVISSFQ